jgi:predicted RNA-binding Zn-ribbon protein involved in translation (DUF1610 family)
MILTCVGLGNWWRKLKISKQFAAPNCGVVTERCSASGEPQLEILQ